MNPPLHVIDGTKSATFDGFVLEVFGINGGSDSKRLALNVIERVGVEAAGDEWMFLVKSHKGGFGIPISLEKKSEWEALVQQVVAACEELKRTNSPS